MAAPRMAPLTPNNVMASGPMQQILDATLVSAADEAPARALKFNPEFEDVVIVQNYDKPVVAIGCINKQTFFAYRVGYVNHSPSGQNFLFLIFL